MATRPGARPLIMELWRSRAVPAAQLAGVLVRAQPVFACRPALDEQLYFRETRRVCGTVVVAHAPSGISSRGKSPASV